MLFAAVDITYRPLDAFSHATCRIASLRRRFHYASALPAAFAIDAGYAFRHDLLDAMIYTVFMFIEMSSPYAAAIDIYASERDMLIFYDIMLLRHADDDTPPRSPLTYAMPCRFSCR